MRAFLQRLTAPPVQTLRILQPTSASVSYTVSTRPVPATILTILARCANILVRLVVGLLTALIVAAKWHVSNREKSSYILVRLGGLFGGWRLLEFAEACQWIYLGPSALVLFSIMLQRNYTEESLTIQRGLGIQTSTTSSIYLQTRSTRFIPATSIQDIFIHEAFKGFEVRFYLAIVVEGEEDVLVVFPRLLPKRIILEEVWRGARKCLWGKKNNSNVRAKQEDNGNDQMEK